MSKTFFFYDLETSGLNPRQDRIMQFAGIRTDMNLEQVGEPVNVLVRLNDDTLPSPEAVLVTGITPQKTLEEGYREAEFAAMLASDIFKPDTCAVGFNSIRFDDEFIRHLMWRNFYDPYEWAYKDGRSRWDLLDVVRMTRALRPDGIKWPTKADGKSINRLELISAENGLNHVKAHDALSDVEALIDVAKLIKGKQPQLFDYLFKMRDKKEVQKLVNLEDKRPFVYASGRYESEFEYTTIAFPLTSSKNGNIAVYDLRYDPTHLVDMTPKDLAAKMYATWEERQADDFVKLPVKELQYNRAPAVAPLGVLEQGDGWKKLRLTQELIEKHKSILLSSPGFAENVRSLYENRKEFKKLPDPEAQLYESFVPDVDKIRIEAVRKSTSTQLADFHPNFVDERLDPLLLHYKGRNFPDSLSEDEAQAWEKWRSDRINAQLTGFSQSLQRLATGNLPERLKGVKDDDLSFILQELQLWGESVLPADIE